MNMEKIDIRVSGDGFLFVLVIYLECLLANTFCLSDV